MNKENRKLNMDAIDRDLNSLESQKVAKAVSSLKDDDLSMAWRSQLNERLAAESHKKVKRLFFGRVWGYVAGLGLSTVAGVSLFLAFAPATINTPGPAMSDSVESQMLAAHHTAVRSADAAVDGLSTLDETDTAAAAKNINEWKQEDLEAL